MTQSTRKLWMPKTIATIILTKYKSHGLPSTNYFHTLFFITWLCYFPYLKIPQVGPSQALQSTNANRGDHPSIGVLHGHALFSWRDQANSRTWTAPNTNILQMYIYHFKCFTNICLQSKRGTVTSASLAFRVLTFTSKISISPEPVSQTMNWKVTHPRTWAVRALGNWRVMGSSPTRDLIFSTSKNFDCSKNNCLSRKWMLLRPRMVGISCSDLYK